MNKLSYLSSYFKQKKLQPFDFQERTWQLFWEGKHGLLNAPTGSGKTFALLLPYLAEKAEQPNTENGEQLELLWITPLKALAKDLEQAMQSVITALQLPITVGRRTGDTSSHQKQKQKLQMPSILITTPESVHVLLTSPEYGRFFQHLSAVVVDEWHELLGSKRGIQVELALSRLRALSPKMRTWGISATIGNLDQAGKVLIPDQPWQCVQSSFQKKLSLDVLLPAEAERFPWAGHLGSTMVSQVVEKIRLYKTSLIFTNTRSQAELWYQRLLEKDPELIGTSAVHHGSIDKAERSWIEDALRQEKLRAVVCTSSLDLGVDFPSVEAVFQIGSPKAIGRFLQRSGRSNHSPQKTSMAYFVPTNSLELIDYLALQLSLQNQKIETRELMSKPIDVLMQYLLTLAAGDGFQAEEILAEVRKTVAYHSLTEDEWKNTLNFLEKGGHTLYGYAQYHKIALANNGRYYMTTPYIARQHRMHIGTITENASLQLKFLKGKQVGNIEEHFISKLSPGDSFLFAGKFLTFIRLHDTTAYVKLGHKKTGHVPRWQGSTMSFSTLLSDQIKTVLDHYPQFEQPPVSRVLSPLITLQSQLSHLPGHQLVIEHMTIRGSHHYFFYPLAGKTLHESLAALIAYRLSKIQPTSFYISANDYGFQLASTIKYLLTQDLINNLLSLHQLETDLIESANMTEMAKRRFRSIAQISGLVSPQISKTKGSIKHLYSSTSVLFDVLQKFESDNLLLHQAFDEVLELQLERKKLSQLCNELLKQPVIFRSPSQLTPFAFPLYVEKFRDQLSSEDFKTKIAALKVKLNSHA